MRTACALTRQRLRGRIRHLHLQMMGKEKELYRDSASKPAGETTNHYNPSGRQEQTIWQTFKSWRKAFASSPELAILPRRHAAGIVPVE